LDKAIDIKRRAQRYVQTGDLDGALTEYQKLVATEDSDPYNYVLLADLLFKKHDASGASERYLLAVAAYEKAGLFKNAIAVCKKMMRLALSPPVVLKRLAVLHALDGLATESSLYYQQFAEHMAREGRHGEAADSLRRAFDTCSDSIKVLEKLADAYDLAESPAQAARAWCEAATHYARLGSEGDAARCASRAESIEPGVQQRFEAEAAERAAGKHAHAEPLPPPPAASSEDDAGAFEHNGSHFPGSSPAPAEPEERHAERAPEPLGLRFGDLDDAEGDAQRGHAHVADVEVLLRRAETEFHAGDREAASGTLLAAAEGYEALGKPESAAVIYRSLNKSASAPEVGLSRWLANCEQRGDRREGAEVSCLLGERAIAQGDLAMARSWFERARGLDPANELAERRLQRLPGDPAKAAAGAAPSGKVSLATGRSDALAPELDSLLAEFQRGVQTHLAGDPQGQYDMGMTYREMGLIDQAVECFQDAGKDRAFTQRCAEMSGRCLLDLGRFDEAVEAFETALALPIFSTETMASLQYQCGLAHEAAGRVPEALAKFEMAYAAQPSYPDAAHKIRLLKRALEQG
jgi:tetratricopeptide (TPR) repeat protein